MIIERPNEIIYPAQQRGNYEIQLADFPWPYTSFGTAKLPYQSMTEQQIAAFDITHWMAKRAVTFLWVTCPKLDIAMRCFDQWAKRYELRYLGVPFIWIKTTKEGKPIGASGPRPSLVKPLGEFVVAYTNVKRGRALPLLTEAMPQWCHEEEMFGDPIEILAPKSRVHSRKPAIVREKISQLFGSEARKVELFAREVADGWDGWGNEYPGASNDQDQHRDQAK